MMRRQQIHWIAKAEAAWLAQQYEPLDEEPIDWLVQPYEGVYLVVHGTGDQVSREVRELFGVASLWEIQPVSNEEWRQHLEATAVRMSIDEALRLKAEISGGQHAA